jgi:acyl-coenzyme A thioesterase PaaI-like protein
MSTDDYEWKLKPDEHWKQVKRFEGGDRTPKFVTGNQSEDRIKIRYFYDEDEKAVWAHVRFGFYAQGPPGHAHGGSVAAVLDEAMGLTAWQSDLSVVAAELSVRFRSPTPLYEEHVIHAWLDEVDGPMARIRSTIASASDPEKVFAQGKGRFVDIGREKFQELANASDRRREASKNN